MQDREFPGLRLTPNEITQVAARVWQINPADLYANTNAPAIVEPRHVVFYHRVKVLGVPVSKIEQETGFSFTTIWRGCNKVAKKLTTDNLLKTRYDLFKILLASENG